MATTHSRLAELPERSQVEEEQTPATSSALRRSFGLDEPVLADIRAVGRCLSPRVPELIEAFYRWLSRLPEFDQFFTDEKLLAHVKHQQANYWRDFLRADVDDAYVERRRLVGQVHARIELGLLIYLQAMEFVSAWLRRQIEADERLRGRPTAAFSIRKLIEFDSAIVVDTYATRTARRLRELQARLEHVAGVMRAVTEGDLSRRIEVAGPEDALGTSVNDMVQSLRDIAREMGLIAVGDYSAHVPPRSSKDELGAALAAMTTALRRTAEKNEQLIWMAESQTQLGQLISGNPSVKELSQRVLTHVCRALEAHVGAAYVLEAPNGPLRLRATYATPAGDGVRDTWELGEGLVGQAAVEKRRILVRLPNDSLRVRWGLGEAIPSSLVLLPVLHEGEVRGVLELGSLGEFTAPQLELLDRMSASVGLAIDAADSRARIHQLLEEARAQGEELTAQQEELRQINDTLAAQTRTLESQKENLLATEASLRQNAAELERASRYKSEFLANMSHELRTPLNSLLILAKLLGDNKEGNLSAEQVKYARTIYSAGNDLLDLINDILDLSKIEAGKVELDIETVRVARLANDLERRFLPLTAEKQLEFTIAVEPDCPASIQTDRQRLQQILTNLLSNAVKFTHSGAIRLRAAAEGARYVSFTVEDTGIGISPEQHEVIFEAFRQADGTTSRRYGGTGLGLTISRELASLLGGELRLRSRAGEGSVFTVLIPLQPPGATVAAPPAAPVSEPASEAADAPAPSSPVVEDDRDALREPRRTILVLESDRVFAAILCDLAREHGFQCIVAGAADEGLRLASLHRPAAVVLDVGLPDHSGLTVLELLKRDPSTRHVPVHVISVHDYQKIAREMGAVGYALKPVKREQLVSVFQALAERLSRKRKSLLIVEDDRVQREAIAALLAADDVEIATAATADEALARLRGAVFDCVVLDLMLPNVSGFELLDRMAADDSSSLPPVIVYTARSLTREEEQKLRSLSRSIIVKGARSPERLLEEVTLFLHQVEDDLPPEKQEMLRAARDRDEIFVNKRILLVEDDVRSIFALTSMLQPKGVAVEIARNGKEALAKLASGPPVDLVLMDLMMPEMDGLQATREIRKNERWAALPIIALTAKAMPDDRVQCLSAGASDYISKPVDAEKLLSLIRVWMPR